MKKPPFSAAEPGRKADLIFAEIERRILNGTWKVGDRLPIDTALAAEFHCSVGTLGKAIDRLTQSGMLERRPRVGTRVLHTSPQHDSSPESATYAFIYPSEKHEGIRRILAGFQGAAYEAEHRSLMIPTGPNTRKEAEALGRLSALNVKGAVLFPVLLTPEDQVYYMQMILACPFPVVLAGVSLIGVRRPTVVLDGLHAGYTMTRHVLAKGARRIGYLGNYAWVSSGRDRYLGYRQAMNEAGVAIQPDDVCLEPSQLPNYKDLLAEPFQMGKRYLEQRPGVEAVVCSNDFLACGCVRAARELGLAVPGQLKVTGIDGFQSLPADFPRLTSYRTPFEEIGQKAFAALITAEQGKNEGPEEILIRGDIIAGDTA